MMHELRMPDLTTNDSPIRIIRWMAQPGDIVQRGQPLLEAETDKATLEVESAVSGRLDRVLCLADEDVAVGQVIALVMIADPASPVVPAAADEAGSAGQVADAAAAPRPAGGEARGQNPSKPVGMFARKRAAKPDERVERTGLPWSSAQRATARRMLSSKQTIPHFYLQTSFDAAGITARRQAAEPHALVWDAFFVRAVAAAISRFDRFGRRLEGESLVPAGTDAVGVAVDLDDDLFVIPISAAATKTVEQISDEIRTTVERLRCGDQDARRIRTALMTVTNLGSCQVERFVPIINPPEPAILGVGTIRLTPVVQDDGQIVAQARGTLTLCVDHRVASGKYAAKFLTAIVDELEREQKESS